MARHPRWVRRFLDRPALDRIVLAVREAEAGTSAEVRVHLDRVCPGDPVQRARVVFERLGLHRTAGRSAVLIYVAVEDRKLAILGDAGIDARVSATYWHTRVEALARHCREGRPGEGLEAALREVAAVLRRHFPRTADDRNELSDEVSLEGDGGPSV